jgi:hypothetical protein
VLPDGFIALTDNLVLAHNGKAGHGTLHGFAF